MKNKKTIILVIAQMLALCFMMVGCGNKTTPEEYAKIFWDFKLKQDTTNVSKLGFTEEESQEIIDNAKKAEKEDLKSMLSEITEADFLDSQIDQIYEKYIEALSKNEVTVERVSKSKDTSEVKIITTYIDITTMIFDSKNKTYEDVNEMRLKTDEGIQYNIASIFTKYFTEELEKVEISSEKAEKSFKFVLKDGGCWIPEDSQEFMVSIGEMSTK